MFFIQCPHCFEWIQILELNCQIFRHGVFKHNFEQIPPHSTLSECTNWKEKDEIFGCGKPFCIVQDPITQVYIAKICDYV
jgi:hypothetical protein